MITRLYLDNCFRHHNRTFTFEKGLTGIIGPNESGKSLIVEMVRYALFGSAALRGLGEDYKKLHVELDFVIAGVPYTVIRKAGKADLVGHATGVRPVDEKIRSILGYDLKVFDVANACNQGNVEALSDMTPTERKQMVDKTIGLNVLDDLIKFCGAEGNTHRREADAMAAGIMEPVLPLEPVGYQPSATIQPMMTLAQGQLQELNKLQGLFQSAPPQPEPRKFLGRAEDLVTAREELREFHQLQGAIAAAPAAPGLIAPMVFRESRQVMEKTIEDRSQLVALRRALASTTAEIHSAEELDEFELWIEQAEKWKQKERLLAQGHICCPSCKHEWPVAADNLAAFDDVKETKPPSISHGDIAKYRSLLGNNEKRALFETAIAELEALPDYTADLVALRHYEATVAAYERQKAAFDDFNKGLKAKQARILALTGIEDRVEQLMIDVRDQEHLKWHADHVVDFARMTELSNLQLTETISRVTAALHEARTFETLLAQYKGLVLERDRLQEAVAVIRQKGEDYLEARVRIQNLKIQIKSHLLPSLNKVASIILNQMTGGERAVISVDDDFEILVDGQAIRTLSGSGKAVANLAIRIALGQILTNRVLSLFMADEVDAAMDEERGAHTAEALRRLKDIVTQVVLVTHKRPETDHQIELSK